jgi:hypothetical protein
MRFTAIVLALACAACASASDPLADYARFRDVVHVGENEQGLPIASSAPANEVKDFNHYAGGEVLAIWVLVTHPPGESPRVVLAGSRAYAILSAEVKPTDEQGAWDRPEPSHVGNPWREADFRFTQRRTDCYGEGYWCNRIQQFEIILSPGMVKAFIAESAPDTIPVSLTSRRKVDWRVPRAELLATLDAAGATDQFR